MFDFSIILPILLAVFVFFGFFCGFIRGPKKTVVRAIWIIIVTVISMILAVNLIPIIFNLDISKFGVNLDGAKNIKEFITTYIVNAVSESEVTLTEEQLSSILSLATGLVSMSVASIFFLVLFILLRILHLPFYYITNLFTRKLFKTEKKHRFIGAIAGTLLGVFTFIIVTIPFTGYLTIVDDVNKVTADENGKGVLSSEATINSIIYDAYLDNTVMNVFDAVGVTKLQNALFGVMSSSSFNDGTIKVKLKDEANTIAKLYVEITPVLNKVQNNEAITEDDRTIIENLISDLSSSKIFTAVRQSSALKGASGLLNKFVNDSMGEDKQIDVSLLVTDIFNFISESSEEEFKNGLNSIVSLAFSVMSLSFDGGIQNLDFNALENLGAGLDGVISSAVIKESTVKSFATDMLDMIKIDNEQIDVEGLISEVGSAIESSTSLSFKNEFKAIGKLFGGVYEVLPGDDEEFSITGEQAEKLGLALDDACNCGSIIINTDLINSLVSNVLDNESIKENEYISPIYEDVKSKFDNNEITAYFNEFKAIGILLDEVTALSGGAENISKEQIVGIGTALDKSIACNSLIIKPSVINKLCGTLIGKVDLGGEMLEDVISDVKDKFNNNEITVYEPEFKAIGEIYSIKDDFTDIDQLTSNDFANIGTTIDNVISYNSVLINEEVIDDLLVTAVKTSFNITEDDENAPEEDQQPLTKAVLSIVKPFENHEIISEENSSSYNKEFSAIGELVSVKDSFSDSQELNSETAKNLGNAIDKSLSYGGKAISRTLVNDLIIDLVDSFMGEEQTMFSVRSVSTSTFTNAINLIKDGFKTFNEGLYVTEFTAIGIVIDGKDKLENGLTDSNASIEVGTMLDDVVDCNAKIITRKVLNTVIVDAMDTFVGETTTLESAVTEIKDGFKTFDSGLYVTEFTAIGKILECKDSLQGDINNSENAINVGKTLDEVVSCNAKILKRDILNNVIVESVETYIKDASDFESAINAIKSGFNSFNEGLYVTEFTAIGKIIDEIDSINTSNLDKTKAQNIGVIFDDVVSLQAKVVNYQIINKFIVDALDKYTNNNDDNNYTDIILDIESYYVNDTIKENYTREFTAIGILCDVKKENANEISSQTARKVGENFDSIISLNAVSITYVTLDDLIITIIDSTFGEVNNDDIYYGVVSDVKGAFDDNHIVHTSQNKSTYTSEFSAIGELISLQNTVSDGTIDADSLVEVGEKLDIATQVTNVKSVKCSTINKMVLTILDNNFTDGDYQESILEIKKPFDINSGVEQVTKGEYTKEFTAFSRLIDFKDNVSGEITPNSAINIGKGLDNVINGRPKSVTYVAINILIDKLVEDNIQGDDLFNDVKDDIKQFNAKNVSKDTYEYENEFTAIKYILNAKNIIESISPTITFNDKAGDIGLNIDNSLSKNAKIINKKFVDSYIKKVIDDDSLIGIDANGSFSHNINKIKENLVYVRNNEYMLGLNYKYTYNNEFKYLAKLSSISSNHIDMSANNSVLAKKLDEIAPSILVGDQGAFALKEEFYKYEEDNDIYSDIFEEINKNLENIVEHGNFGINYGKDSYIYTYQKMEIATRGLYSSLSDVETKIVGQTTFDTSVAGIYQGKLDDLQRNNILVSKNGARAIARHILNDVNTILCKKIDELPVINAVKKGEFKQEISDLTSKYQGYYTKYLNKNSYEYYTLSTNTYANFNNNYAIVYTSSDNTIQVNYPFTSILGWFEERHLI